MSRYQNSGSQSAAEARRPRGAAGQYAVDDLPGTPRRVVRADGVLGYHPRL